MVKSALDTILQIVSDKLTIPRTLFSFPLYSIFWLSIRSLHLVQKTPSLLRQSMLRSKLFPVNYQCFMFYQWRED